MKPICLSLCALAAATTLFILYSPTAHAAQNAAKIAGDLTLTKDSNGNSTGIHFSDGTSQFTGNPWGTANSTSPDIGFVQGKVGIGTLTPATALDVTGDINLSGNLLLPATTSATSGIIKKNNETFIHSNGTNSFFAGRSAGNLSASGGNNTGIGAFTLNALDNIGFKNTAVGSKALDANTSGSNNAAFGISAGGTGGDFANVTGSGNTFIGAYSGPGTATVLNNATAIGYTATVSQSNSMVLGGTGANAVKVGIGTTTPTVQLDVVGDAKISGTLTTGTITSGAWNSNSSFRVIGTPGAAWPSPGEGVEIAHDSTANKGFIQSYDRGTGLFGALDINASTVTVGGTPGNLAVSGVISGNGSGLTNVTPVQGIAGPAPASIAGGSATFVFVGPTVVLTTTASQQLVGSMTAVLGTSTTVPFPYLSFDFNICFRQNGTSNDPITFTPNFTTADMTAEVGRKTYAVATTRMPGAGTWEIGYCLKNASTTAIDDNDYVNGWIMTTN